jgi:hypothetical protein
VTNVTAPQLAAHYQILGRKLGASAFNLRLAGYTERKWFHFLRAHETLLTVMTLNACAF